MITEILTSYIKLFELLFQALERLYTHVDKRHRRIQIVKSPLGETIEKVEIAQNHLSDAIEAISLIKEQAIDERHKLDTLLEEVKKKHDEHTQAVQELETAQDLLSQNKENLRSVLGISPARERIIGFFSGVAASIVASGLWLFGGFLLEKVKSLLG
ncbi:hypothetical protein IAI53_08370 [Thauera sp. CAU 1555]|uniref:Uncharacterized protein n=1 Tax=Thauera sedimentorum TaxID=2767595 RepID=A0ABR9BAB1_9RHOO|nr:hypothetical protein [Thauera sedimentorum]MBC9071975.1 hypothetical protein [Thauera sedimentorum]MBD8502894.1 hypothetical protein [Thauera sedimentorum]